MRLKSRNRKATKGHDGHEGLPWLAIVSVVAVREAAEEVVQDVMLELCRRRSALDPAGSVRAYLFTAVRNRTLNVIRHERATARAIPLFILEERERQQDGEGADVGARETELEAAVG